MDKSLLVVKVTMKYNELSRILLRLDISYKDLIINGDNIVFKISNEDYEKFKLYYKDIKIVRKLGINGVKSFIKKHYILLCSFIFTYIILILLSNVIFDVEIVSNNYELKRVINLYLEENNIKKHKFVKSHKEIESIKKKILENNKDTLEWIEIERVGTKYIVNLTERVINENKTTEEKKDLVAKKDALIKYLIIKSGTGVKEVNELVKKGDIIITGNIIKNEEVIDRVNANGKVYGETWYTVNTTVPYKHVDYEKTGKIVNHVYLSIFGHKFTLYGKYDTKNEIVSSKVLIDKPYLFFKVIKDRKEIYNYVTHTLTEEEAYKEAIKRSERVIKDKLASDEYIIDKKVLKNNKYSSKIEVEIFYKVYENIGEYKEPEIIE